MKPPSCRDPDILAFLDRLTLDPGVSVDGSLAGRHRSPLSGRSLEFAQHREYVPGDDPRHVDWKVYGRRDKLFVRQHRQETNLTTHLLVDRSASMDFGAGAPYTKFAYACALAGYTAYLLLHQGDAVGLSYLDGGVSVQHPPRGGGDRFDVIAGSLETSTCAGSGRLSSGLSEALATLNRRSLVVLFSDLAESEDALLPLLRTAAAAGIRLLVVQVVDPVERDLSLSGNRVRFLDPEEIVPPVTTARPEVRDAYIREFAAMTDRYARELMAAGITYLLASTDQPIRTTLARMAGA